MNPYILYRFNQVYREQCSGAIQEEAKIVLSGRRFHQPIKDGKLFCAKRKFGQSSWFDAVGISRTTYQKQFDKS